MRRPAPRRALVVSFALALGLLVGLSAGMILSDTANQDQIIVGNTAGTLSAVIRIQHRLIVVGGGDSRTDLGDLVGRATLPWSRRVDLLVVPGWDTGQATGALGLIEQGNVRQVVILGAANTHPVWNLLEQSAGRYGAQVSYLEGEQDLPLGPHAALTFSAASGSGTSVPGALVRLGYDGLDLLLADIDSAATLKTLAGWDAIPTDAQLLIAARPVDTSLVRAQLVLRPAASRAVEVSGLAPSYVGELRPGERLTITLDNGSARLPLNRLRPQYPTPKSG